MKFLTYDECAAWCSDHGFLADAHEQSIAKPQLDELPGSFDLTKFTIPTDSGRKVAFSRLLHSLFDPSNDLLIWLDSWSVWPSCMHMPLFTRFRQALGEDRPLIDIPGHVVAHGESDDAISLITIAMQFIWDCHILCVKETGNVSIFERLGFRTVRETEEDFFVSDVCDGLTNVYMERPVGVPLSHEAPH